MAAVDRDLPPDRLIGDARQVTFGGVVRRVAKPDADAVWEQLAFTDSVENRPALSRTCMAWARRVQSLVAMDCWADMAAQFEPVGGHVMDTPWVAAPIAGLRGESANRRRGG